MEDIIEWEKDHQTINYLRNHLKVVNEQGELELYINGELVDKAEIDSASKGVKAGISTSTFDNFNYSGIPYDS